MNEVFGYLIECVEEFSVFLSFKNTHSILIKVTEAWLYQSFWDGFGASMMVYQCMVVYI